MESFMNAAVLIEITVVSFLLALCVTWVGLRGLFQLMPGRRMEAVPIRLSARAANERARQQEIPSTSRVKDSRAWR